MGLRHLAESILRPVMLIQSAADTSLILYANTAACQLLGVAPRVSLLGLLTEPSGVQLRKGLQTACDHGSILDLELTYASAVTYHHDIYRVPNGYLILSQPVDSIQERMERLVAAVYQEAWQHSRYEAASAADQPVDLESSEAVLDTIDAMFPWLFSHASLAIAVIGCEWMSEEDRGRLPIGLRTGIRASDLLIPYGGDILLLVPVEDEGIDSMVKRLQTYVSGYAGAAIRTGYISPPSRQGLQAAIRRLSRLLHSPRSDG